MLTPKEQAYELFDEFMGFKMQPYDDPEMSHKKSIVKRYCRIAVKQITNHSSLSDSYWEEVIEEINKI